MIWLRIKMAFAAVAGVLVAMAAVYFKGRNDQKAKQKYDDLEDYQNTRKRIDEADIPTDADAAREWLSERQRRGDM